MGDFTRIGQEYVVSEIMETGALVVEIELAL